MKKYFIIILGVCYSIIGISQVNLQNVRVKIYSSYNDNRFVLKILKGSYAVLNSKKDTIKILNPQDILYVFAKQISADLILKDKKGNTLGNYAKVFITPLVDSSLYISEYAKKSGKYDGSLFLKWKEASVYIEGIIPIESYIAGVLEAEAGHTDEKEFLKAQAIIVRSYLLNKLIPYSIKNGINTIYSVALTDNTNFQVYYGIPRLQNKDAIIKAVYETKGLVITDTNHIIAQTVFHANSGGITANSEEVWQMPISYMRAVKDPFSLNQPSNFWERVISLQEYFNFYKENHPEIYISLKKSNNLNLLTSIFQETRTSFFKIEGEAISYIKMRKYFRLRSAFFDINIEDNRIVFKGRGYGHGIGLSQQGAIQMSKLDYNFKQIIDFYYNGVILVKIPDGF